MGFFNVNTAYTFKYYSRICNMQFRDATIQDLPLIVQIYNSTVAGRMVTADTELVTVDDKQQWFKEHSHNRPVWMLEEVGETIGWISFQDFYGRVAYQGTAEISIYIDEKFRGKGYGKKALNLCIKEAPKLKLHTLLGFIFSHNFPSVRLFLLCGFEQWGELKEIAIMDSSYYSLKIFGRKV